MIVVSDSYPEESISYYVSFFTILCLTRCLCVYLYFARCIFLHMICRPVLVARVSYGVLGAFF